jgi:hypothetical protein
MIAAARGDGKPPHSMLDSVHHWPAGNTCNIKYSPLSLEQPGGLARPEEYGDLLVRVAGYSAYFTQLSKTTQDEILSRTEHAV